MDPSQLQPTSFSDSPSFEEHWNTASMQESFDYHHHHNTYLPAAYAQPTFRAGTGSLLLNEDGTFPAESIPYDFEASYPSTPYYDHRLQQADPGSGVYPPSHFVPHPVHSPAPVLPRAPSVDSACSDDADDGTANAPPVSTHSAHPSGLTAPVGLLVQELHGDGRPRRPMNAFMIYSRHRRPDLQKQEPGIKTGELSKILSKEWKSLPPAKKAFYLEQSKILKDIFHKRFPNYVYKRGPNGGRRRSSSSVRGLHSSGSSRGSSDSSSRESKSSAGSIGSPSSQSLMTSPSSSEFPSRPSATPPVSGISFGRSARSSGSWTPSRSIDSTNNAMPLSSPLRSSSIAQRPSRDEHLTLAPLQTHLSGAPPSAMPHTAAFAPSPIVASPALFPYISYRSPARSYSMQASIPMPFMEQQWSPANSSHYSNSPVANNPTLHGQYTEYQSSDLAEHSRSALSSFRNDRRPVVQALPLHRPIAVSPNSAQPSPNIDHDHDSHAYAFQF